MMSVCQGMTQMLSCSVCKAPYTDPHQLDCGHVYCRRCLLDTLKEDTKKGRTLHGNEITCPDCKKVTSLGNKGVSGLTPNVALSCLVTKLRAYQTEGGVCLVPSKSKKSRVKITSAETIPYNSGTARVQIVWSTKAPRVMFFEVTCETGVDKKDLTFEEKVSTFVGEMNTVEFSGLRYSQEYTVTVRGQSELGFEVNGELTFRTRPKVNCEAITLDVGNSHPAVTLMGNYDFVVYDSHSHNVPENNIVGGEQFWQRVQGIGSYYSYDHGNLYWEVLIDFQVHAKLKTEVLLATVGICKAMKGDTFSPLERNFHAHTCTLFKRGGSRSIGITMSDGREDNQLNVDLFNLRDSIMDVRLGFFLDLDKNLFKIFWRKGRGDQELYSFRNMTTKPVALICELLNEDKAQTSIKFISGDAISSLPETLYK